MVSQITVLKILVTQMDLVILSKFEMLWLIFGLSSLEYKQFFFLYNLRFDNQSLVLKVTYFCLCMCVIKRVRLILNALN